MAGPPTSAPPAALSQLATIEAILRSDNHSPMATSSFIDRLRGTGVLSPQVALSRGALGPVGRASGSEEDIRVYRPYGPDAMIKMPADHFGDSGDALGRQLVRNEEIRGAFELCRRALEELAGHPPVGRGTAPVALVDGTAWAWVEAPQGELLDPVLMEG